MKSPRLAHLLVTALLAAPIVAQAHPGHDGDHDFVWDFGHLIGSPLATTACVSVLIAAGWGVWRLVKSRPEAKTQRAKRD